MQRSVFVIVSQSNTSQTINLVHFVKNVSSVARGALGRPNVLCDHHERADVHLPRVALSGFLDSFETRHVDITILPGSRTGRARCIGDINGGTRTRRYVL